MCHENLMNYIKGQKLGIKFLKYFTSILAPVAHINSPAV